MHSKKLLIFFLLLPLAFALPTLPLLPCMALIAVVKPVQKIEFKAEELSEEAFQLAQEGQYERALSLYQQALVIYKTNENYLGESLTYANIDNIHEVKNKPQLAIIFYKKSLTIYNITCTDRQNLPKERQEFYAKTAENTYRKLADLLLSLDRVLEARQVLEELKLQEVDRQNCTLIL